MIQKILPKNKTIMCFLSPISVGVFAPKGDFIFSNDENIDSIIRLRKLRKTV